MKVFYVAAIKKKTCSFSLYLWLSVMVQVQGVLWKRMCETTQEYSEVVWLDHESYDLTCELIP